MLYLRIWRQWKGINVVGCGFFTCTAVQENGPAIEGFYLRLRLQLP
jgi:hypothetical protein